MSSRRKLGNNLSAFHGRVIGRRNDEAIPFAIVKPVQTKRDCFVPRNDEELVQTDAYRLALKKSFISFVHSSASTPPSTSVLG